MPINVKHTIIAGDSILGITEHTVVREGKADEAEVARLHKEKGIRITVEQAAFMRYCKRFNATGTAKLVPENLYNTSLVGEGTTIFLAYEDKSVAQEPTTWCLMNNINNKPWLVIEKVDDKEISLDDLYV